MKHAAELHNSAGFMQDCPLPDLDLELGDASVQEFHHHTNHADVHPVCEIPGLSSAAEPRPPLCQNIEAISDSEEDDSLDSPDKMPDPEAGTDTVVESHGGHDAGDQESSVLHLTEQIGVKEQEGSEAADDKTAPGFPVETPLAREGPYSDIISPVPTRDSHWNDRVDNAYVLSEEDLSPGDLSDNCIVEEEYGEDRTAGLRDSSDPAGQTSTVHSDTEVKETVRVTVTALSGDRSPVVADMVAKVRDEVDQSSNHLGCANQDSEKEVAGASDWPVDFTADFASLEGTETAGTDDWGTLSDNPQPGAVDPSVVHSGDEDFGDFDDASFVAAAPQSLVVQTEGKFEVPQECSCS